MLFADLSASDLPTVRVAGDILTKGLIASKEAVGEDSVATKPFPPANLIRLRNRFRGTA